MFRIRLGKDSDLFDIGCREDSDFSVGLPEPPAVLLLVVDVDHLPVGDAQLVVPGQGGDNLTTGTERKYDLINFSHVLMI